MTKDREIPYDDVVSHTSRSDCWIALQGKVYNVTDFMANHPGGLKAIAKRCGTEATQEFNLLHPKSTYDLLSPYYIGNATGTPPPPVEPKATSKPTEFYLPSLDAMLSLKDFEKTAKAWMQPQGWAYYYSASDDLVTKSFNHDIFQKVLLRPRIFKDVSKIDTKSSIQGIETELPIFICPAAMGKLAHEEGEAGIGWAAAEKGILQIVSNNSSMSFEEIVSSDYSDAEHEPNFMFQLYVQKNKEDSHKRLDSIMATGKCKGIVLTLDAAAPANREDDDRAKFEGAPPEFDPDAPWAPFEDDALGAVGIGKSIFLGTSSELVWKDLEWIQAKAPGLPIIVKGLQTVEDCVEATKHPEIKGILLSNHGGRSVDTSQPPLLVLQELRTYAPQVFDKTEVYIDGGIRRGTDVVKALCLGAKQVGIGRPALYGLAGYGRYGVLRTLDILQAEVETNMKLLGVSKLSDLGPQFLNTRQLDEMVAKLDKNSFSSSK